MLSSLKQKIKDWYHTVFTPYASIALARLTSLLGIVVGIIGAIDWTPAINLVQSTTGFTSKQLAWTGIVALIQGISFEIARRSNANLKS